MTAIEAAILHGSALETPNCTSSSRSGLLIRFGDPVPYSIAWALQQQFHAERLSGSRTDTLILLEHLPVYTAGRRTKTVHLKPRDASSDHPMVPIEKVSRGGSITYHGPGQLIGYPILVLSRYASGAKRYVQLLEEVLIRTLLYWEIQAYRVVKAPGVWTRDKQGEAKIASIGARIDRGITLHGFALNVCNDLLPFSRIVPCGLDGCRMTSMEQTKQASISVPLVAEHLAREFSTVFQLKWSTVAPDSTVQTDFEAQPVVASRRES